MQTMQQVTYAAKGLAGLLAGWALGHGLMWGAVILGALLGQATSDVADRALLGGMLLAIGLLAVLLVSASLAELRRVPGLALSLPPGNGHSAGPDHLRLRLLPGKPFSGLAEAKDGREERLPWRRRRPGREKAAGRPRVGPPCPETARRRRPLGSAAPGAGRGPWSWAPPLSP